MRDKQLGITSSDTVCWSPKSKDIQNLTAGLIAVPLMSYELELSHS